MQLGMIGLGRMGASMVRRLMIKGHACVVYARHPSAVASLQNDGAIGAASMSDMVSRMSKPCAIWLMVPAAAVDQVLGDLVPLLEVGDIVIDGGDSYYRDDIRRGIELQASSVRYLDVGTSGGVAGIERGYCLMIGGDADLFEHLRPIFAALAPGVAAATRTPGRKSGSGRVSDSGEGRWTIQAAIDQAVPVPVPSAGLYARFTSRGQADFANQVLSAMRHAFGGHVEKTGEEPT